MRLRTPRWAAMALCLAVAALAQDPVKVDPKHYKVEMENAQVRVLHVHYGPHEKSVMHSHPADVAVFLTDAQGKFTYPDGKTESFSAKAGQAQYFEPVTHLPENSSDKPFDLVLVELKSRGAAKPAASAGAAAKKPEKK